MLELQHISYNVEQDGDNKGILHDINLTISERFVAITGPNGGGKSTLAKDYIDREVDASLSGGELKRIEIATIMARSTALSVFDEPEAGIDLWSFSNLIQVFEHLHEKINGSILIISHQERILNIADRIIVLAEGRVQNDGPRKDILPTLLGGAPGVCSALTDKVR